MKLWQHCRCWCRKDLGSASRGNSACNNGCGPATRHISINSLDPGKSEWNFRYVICKRFLVIDGWGISCEIALIWMSLDFTDDQSTLFQVMAWCCQATSHYLSQCWPRSLSPYGVTRPQWVDSLNTGKFNLDFKFPISKHILLNDYSNSFYNVITHTIFRIPWNFHKESSTVL